MRIITGKRKTPPRVLVYGAHGVGKTTFAAAAPRPLVIATEAGADGIGVDRTPTVGSFSDLLATLREAAATEYETIILDSLSACEPLIRAQTMAAAKLTDESYEAYGRGASMSVVHWGALVSALDDVHAAGKGIVCVAHAATKVLKNPSGADYAAHVIAMPEAAAALVCRWADEVLFARLDLSVDKGKATTTGNRFLFAAPGEGAIAKNRCGLPDRLPLSWSAYQSARDAYYANAPDAKADAAAALALVPEEHPKREAMAAAFAACKTEAEFAAFSRRVHLSLKPS